MTQSKSLNKRFLLASLCALLSSVVLGVGFGLIRHNIINLSTSHILSGFLIALVVKNVGRSIYVRFSIVAVIAALLAIVISDIVSAYGLTGLTSIDLMIATFEYSFSYDIETIIWLSYRGLAMYIAYSYSRLI